MLNDCTADPTPSDVPAPSEDLLALGLPAEVAAYQAEASGGDLVRVVCTNIRTGRELTAWVPVSVPAGDELDSRCDEIEAAWMSSMPERVHVFLSDYIRPEVKTHRRAYAPERYLLALVLNHARMGRPGIASSEQRKYQPYKEQLGRALLVDKRSPDEMTALKRRLCDEYTDQEVGRAHATNAEQRKRAREAFNKAMGRYLSELAKKPAARTR
jgi:hypothetical protein